MPCRNYSKRWPRPLYDQNKLVMYCSGTILADLVCTGVWFLYVWGLAKCLPQVQLPSWRCSSVAFFRRNIHSPRRWPQWKWELSAAMKSETPIPMWIPIVTGFWTGAFGTWMKPMLRKKLNCPRWNVKEWLDSTALQVPRPSSLQKSDCSLLVMRVSRPAVALCLRHLKKAAAICSPFGVWLVWTTQPVKMEKEVRQNSWIICKPWARLRQLFASMLTALKAWVEKKKVMYPKMPLPRIWQCRRQQQRCKSKSTLNKVYPLCEELSCQWINRRKNHEMTKNKKKH